MSLRRKSLLAGTGAVAALSVRCTLGSLVLFTALVTLPSALTAQVKGLAVGDSNNQTRTRQPLNEGWRFKRQASPGAAVEPEFVAAEQPGYDDSSWPTVFLPHTWDATPDKSLHRASPFSRVGVVSKRFCSACELARLPRMARI